MREILGTVFCVSYYKKEFVEECLQSYAKQTIRDKLKLVFIDNGSDFNKKELFDKYAIEGDIFERFEENRIIGRIQYAIEKYGEGKGYTILMDDDIIPVDGLEKRMMPVINGDYQVVHTGLKNIGDEIGILHRAKLENRKHIVYGTLAFSPEAYNKVGGLSQELRYQTDYLFIELLKLEYEIGYVSDVTLLYRYHLGAESTTQTKESRAIEHAKVRELIEIYKTERNK
jgi:hypothetical protein